MSSGLNYKKSLVLLAIMVSEQWFGLKAKKQKRGEGNVIIENVCLSNSDCEEDSNGSNNHKGEVRDIC